MTTNDNPSRDAILGRIRSALTKPAPPAAPIRDSALFPPVGDLLERLQKELAASLVDCTLTTDSASSARAIEAAISALPPGEIFVQDAPILRELVRVPEGSIPNGSVATGLCPVDIRWSTEGHPSESSQATISLCEILVASTGSIVVSSACGGRAASIIAPVHIVYATTTQIVSDLDAAMEHIHKAGLLNSSFISFQTGASRTGDIEKILVHGAHGPRKVILILQES